MITATYGSELSKKTEDNIIDLFSKMTFIGVDMAKPGSERTVKYKKRQCSESCHIHCEGNHGFEISEVIKHD